MLKNAKAKGARQELRAKRFLEASGYRVCKAGASLGEWDLIAISGDLVLLCQVKSNIWPPPGERKKLELFDAPWAAYKTMWRYDDRANKPRIKVWINPTGVWEWLEVNQLPYPFVDEEGHRAIRFDFTVPPKIDPPRVMDLGEGTMDEVVERFLEFVRKGKEQMGKEITAADFQKAKQNLVKGPDEWPDEI